MKVIEPAACSGTVMFLNLRHGDVFRLVGHVKHYMVLECVVVTTDRDYANCVEVKTGFPAWISPGMQCERVDGAFVVGYKEQA